MAYPLGSGVYASQIVWVCVGLTVIWSDKMTKSQPPKMISLLRLSRFLSFFFFCRIQEFVHILMAPLAACTLQNQTSKCREIYSINIIWVSPKTLGWLSQQSQHQNRRHLGQGYANVRFNIHQIPSKMLIKKKKQTSMKEMQLTALLHKRE